MNIGMLWFDNDPRLEVGGKIEKAASYYRKKYGKAPDLCYIHPSMVATERTNPEAEKKVRIEIRTSKTILPNYFWIGVNNRTGES